MTLAAGLAKFRERAMANVDAVVRLTVEAAGERMIVLSPVGDPVLWKRPESAPPGYQGGEFRSNWFYAANAPSNAFRPGVVNVREVNDIEAVPQKAGGMKHFIFNADPKGPSLEVGHSSQAPNGFMGVIQFELPDLLRIAAKQVAQ